MPDNGNEKVVILPKAGSLDTSLSFGKNQKYQHWVTSRPSIAVSVF